MVAAIGVGLSACVTSKTKLLAQVDGSSQTDTTSVRIFLLERDITSVVSYLVFWYKK